MNNWLNSDHATITAWMVMIEANASNAASYASFSNGLGNDQSRLREAFVQAGNVLENQPDAKFWASKRYYRRYHIQICPLGRSGNGAGVEDLPPPVLRTLSRTTTGRMDSAGSRAECVAPFEENLGLMYGFRPEHGGKQYDY